MAEKLRKERDIDEKLCEMDVGIYGIYTVFAGSDIGLYEVVAEL